VLSDSCTCIHVRVILANERCAGAAVNVVAGNVAAGIHERLTVLRRCGFRSPLEFSPEALLALLANERCQTHFHCGWRKSHVECQALPGAMVIGNAAPSR